uniref:Uncharacterized protein n=1 Tax=Oryzias sinensis TaxID=183150 RepID=A0A8C7XD17_9TELE
MRLNVPVMAYRSNKKRNHLNQKVKKPDYKVAYVQLVRRLTTHIQTLRSFRNNTNISVSMLLQLYYIQPHVLNKLQKSTGRGTGYYPVLSCNLLS